MNNSQLERLSGSPGCFICDNDNSNPRALRLKLMWEEQSQTVSIDLIPDETWCGYSNIVHGGLIASVLDEAMAWAIKRKTGEWAFTADFQVRYKRPVKPGCAYQVKAQADAAGGRLINAKAELIDNNGKLTALAKAVFLPASGKAKPWGSAESAA